MRSEVKMWKNFSSRDLLTYGWAILCVLFLIGILSSLGLLPQNRIEGRVYVGPPFHLASEKIGKNSVVLELWHDGEEVFEVNSVTISNCGVQDVSRSILPETKFLVRVDCSSPRETGSIFDEDIFI